MRSALGRPGRATVASRTRMTRCLAKDVSTSSARHSRVKLSRTGKTRIVRPLASPSLTKASHHSSFDAVNTGSLTPSGPASCADSVPRLGHNRTVSSGALTRSVASAKHHRGPAFSQERLHGKPYILPLSCEPQPFFEIIAFRTSRSSLRSATKCFRWRFSSSSWCSRCASVLHLATLALPVVDRGLADSRRRN